MYAYCGNNPVNRTDSSGNLWHVAFGAALGGVLSGISKAIECVKRGDSLGKTIGQVLVSTTCGAIGGALAATGIGIGGQALIGATLGAVESAANQMITTGTVDASALITDTVCGAIGGIAGGKGASNGSKFMSYHRKEFMKNISLDGFGKALGKLTKHTWKWASSNLSNATTSGVINAFAGNKVVGTISSGIRSLYVYFVEDEI